MAGPGRKKQRTRTSRVTEMADFLGCAEQSIRNWMRLPDWPGADDGSVALYDLAVWRYRVESGADLEAGEEFGSSDSPNLERMRSAKADMLEMERDAKRGKYMLADDVDALLAEAAVVYRDAADKTQRICPDAAEIIEEAVLELERRLMRKWEDDRGDGDETGDGNADGDPPAG